MTCQPLFSDPGAEDRLVLAEELAERDDDYVPPQAWALPDLASGPAPAALFPRTTSVDRVVGSFGRLTGRPIDPHEVDEQLAHESEHAAAAVAVGFGSVRYFLRAQGDGRGRLEVGLVYANPQVPITKLAFAAVQAAPAGLTVVDLAVLHLMGYQDVDDVAARVIRHNRSPDVRPLPTPISYWRHRGISRAR